MSRIRKAKVTKNPSSAKPAGKLGFCRECNKQTFSDRKVARSDAKKAFPNEQLNAFRCPIGRGWHYGHLREGDR